MTSMILARFPSPAVIVTEEHLCIRPQIRAYCREHEPEEVRDLPVGERVERFDESDLTYFIRKEVRAVTEDDPMKICYCSTCHKFLIPNGEYMALYGAVREGEHTHVSAS